MSQWKEGKKLGYNVEIDDDIDIRKSSQVIYPFYIMVKSGFGIISI